MTEVRTISPFYQVVYYDGAANKRYECIAATVEDALVLFRDAGIEYQHIVEVNLQN